MGLVGAAVVDVGQGFVGSVDVFADGAGVLVGCGVCLIGVRNSGLFGCGCFCVGFVGGSGGAVLVGRCICGVGDDELFSDFGLCIGGVDGDIGVGFVGAGVCFVDDGIERFGSNL